MDGPLDILASAPKATFRNVVIDPPWKFSAGTKSRPQHYPRMTFDEICQIPIKTILHPEGARVFCWITGPLLDRIGYLKRAWGLKYSTSFPWLKLWPNAGELFFDRASFAKGLGFEVAGNAEYIVILKYRTPQNNGRDRLPGFYITPRREHSRKPPDLHEDIERRFSGPYAEIFARESREGWSSFGNETTKFDSVESTNQEVEHV